MFSLKPPSNAIKREVLGGDLVTGEEALGMGLVQVRMIVRPTLPPQEGTPTLPPHEGTTGREPSVS